MHAVRDGARALRPPQPGTKAMGINSFRHGVRVGLSEVRRIPGPAKTVTQLLGNVLLEVLRDREHDVLCFAHDLNVSHHKLPQVAGPGRASPSSRRHYRHVPRPIRRGVLDGCFQDLHRVHGLRPDFERLGTPLSHHKGGLLPGLLAATRAGLPSASDDELTNSKIHRYVTASPPALLGARKKPQCFAQ
ncbi:hypothetical protein GCM10023096_09130 [Nonomuraea ferruginea]